MRICTRTDSGDVPNRPRLRLPSCSVGFAIGRHSRARCVIYTYVASGRIEDNVHSPPPAGTPGACFGFRPTCGSEPLHSTRSTRPLDGSIQQALPERPLRVPHAGRNRTATAGSTDEKIRLVFALTDSELYATIDEEEINERETTAAKL